MTAALTVKVLSPREVEYRDRKGKRVFTLYALTEPYAGAVAVLHAPRWYYSCYLTSLGTAFGVPHRGREHEKYGWLLDMAREAGMEFPGDE